MTSSTSPHGDATASIPPRRSSWAEVAAGMRPHQPPTLVTLPPFAETDRLSYPQATLGDRRVTDIPANWGSGRSNMTRVASLGSSDEDSEEPLGFFIPSYLLGTKYVERLEAAYNAELEALREEPPPRSSHAGSLSTSSSNMSLHKLAPSHRGMTYEIIERQPEVVQTPRVPPLPSKWAETDRFGALAISRDGLQVGFNGSSKVGEHEAASTRADHPIPPQCGIYYFEVYIKSKGKDGMIAIGFSGPNVSLEKLPGWEIDSWAYHGDDGKSFCQHSQGREYGDVFGTNDTVGCGINFMTGSVFFTKNGVSQGTAFKDLSVPKGKKLFPSIGMKRPHAQITVNFGQDVFAFKIGDVIIHERLRLEQETLKADVSKLHANLGQEDLCKALVAQYLSHDGYVETASAFAAEVRSEATALRGSLDPRLENHLSVEEDQDAVYRQQIRTAIIQGDVDRAIEYTNTYYPQVLEKNPQIYFRLRCRKFIEMMRQSAELLDTPSNKRTRAANEQSGVGFEPEMDLDEPMKDGDESDRMSTEDTSDTKYALQTAMVEYAKELKAEFKDKRESMTEIFSMFGYEDPRKSPHGKLLDTSQRAPVAEALNSAILVSLEKSPSTALERLCRQTSVLLDIISEQGGPGSLINIDKIINPSDYLP